MSRTPGGVQKVCNEACAHFSAPYLRPLFPLQGPSDCSLVISSAKTSNSAGASINVEEAMMGSVVLRTWWAFIAMIASCKERRQRHGQTGSPSVELDMQVGMIQKECWNARGAAEIQLAIKTKSSKEETLNFRRSRGLLVMLLNMKAEPSGLISGLDPTHEPPPFMQARLMVEHRIVSIFLMALLGKRKFVISELGLMSDRLL